MFYYSTRQHPELHPIDAMRAVFGPAEINAVDDIPLDFSVTALTLPSVRISVQESSPFKLKTSASDDIRLTFAEQVGACFKSGMEEVWLGDGDALIHPAESHTALTFSPARWHSVRISRAAIAPLVGSDAGWTLRRVAGNVPAIGLWRHYISGLLAPGGPGSAGLEAVVATHIRDLAALVVGANRDGAHEAMSGGVMAARFHAARRFIAENLLDPALTDETAAKALGISPRYLKKLFAREGGFYTYLTGQRLNFAYSLLTNPVHARTKVIDIAFQCGFTSLSTFNRQFKNRFGISPTEARPC